MIDAAVAEAESVQVTVVVVDESGITKKMLRMDGAPLSVSRLRFTNKVLLRGEESGGAVAIAENTMPAGAPGPPLHSHVFDEPSTSSTAN